MMFNIFRRKPKVLLSIPFIGKTKDGRYYCEGENGERVLGGERLNHLCWRCNGRLDYCCVHGWTCPICDFGVCKTNPDHLEKEVVDSEARQRDYQERKLQEHVIDEIDDDLAG